MNIEHQPTADNEEPAAADHGSAEPADSADTADEDPNPLEALAGLISAAADSLTTLPTDVASDEDSEPDVHDDQPPEEPVASVHIGKRPANEIDAVEFGIYEVVKYLVRIGSWNGDNGPAAPRIPEFTEKYPDAPLSFGSLREIGPSATISQFT